KAAYEKSIEYARAHSPITIEMLTELSSLVMKNTGKEYKTALGDFSSARGQLRLLNVTAGFGGKSYMNYSKVPAKLAELCDQINEARRGSKGKDFNQLYSISFDAHFELVTIHPWADGNGRMARLLMNQLQFEFGLIPSIILKEDKEDYTKSLIAARESEDLNIFREFMFRTTAKVLRRDIDNYLQSTGLLEEESPAYSTHIGKKPKSREIILNMLSKDGSLSAASLARRIGISPKAVEKHLANLKAAGLLRRIGPDKGGHWEVNT
ncbi:MAG TPA: cell filamentation protein Fic, partial [Rikenellaceae bacterium]|nr:cell filamentation protein Fic [Rikenellaceae bacterium]